MVPDTLSWHPPMDPSCSTLSPAASPTATPDTILVEESFLVRLSAAYFNASNSEIRNLPNFLGILIPIVILFTSSLLPRWPAKSIRMHLCNESSLKGMNYASF